MPTLDFKGKQFVYSHHLGVPFRELQVVSDKSLPTKGQKPSLDDNLIIHGDNVEALKALLPTHAGKVDCIFIDPPYNTGNEGWCYNDNVRSPLMKEWLKKSANPVDKEDLERHDKWLCMMWPRLNLLKELLSPTGVIFATIDDNEGHRLRDLLDEIFGEERHVATIVWQKRYSRENREAIGDVHDYIHVYAMDKEYFKATRNKLDPTDDQLEVYRNPNNDPKGRWRPVPITAQAGHATKDQFYDKTPSGQIHTPPEGRCWGMNEATFKKLRDEGRIYFGKNGDAQPNLIRYASEVEGFVPWTWWPSNEAGHTDEAKKELMSIIKDSEFAFDTIKPVRLLHRIFQMATHRDSLILDSFAGSGSTAHAVLALNSQDQGQRRFILVECEDYADTLTAERVRRVIKGYPYTGTQREELHRENITWSTFEKKRAKVLEHVASIENLQGHEYDTIKKQIKDGVLTVTGERKVKETAPGLGGSFTYCTLGEPIDIESLLTGNGLPGFEALARYVFYTATGQSLEKSGKPAPDGFIGETDLFRVHLFYQPDREWLRSNDAALNAERMAAIEKGNKSGKRAIVFAVAKFMSQKELTARRIEFCQLPYAVHRILGGLSMELKEYQQGVLSKLDRYLTVLAEQREQAEDFVEFQKSKGKSATLGDYCGEAWDQLNTERLLPYLYQGGNAVVARYLSRHDGLGQSIPNICFKVPTGGGKTLLATAALERVQTDYFKRQTGLVLWVVPSEAIYRQTWKQLANREHPYRQMLERASGGRVKLLEKGDAFTRRDAEGQLCVMLLMLPSAARKSKETLRLFRDSGRFTSFFPVEDDSEANRALLDQVLNLDQNDLADLGFGEGIVPGSISIKQSLGNVLRLVRPVVVIDEGHKAYSDTARDTLAGFNPRFMLELSATPNTNNKHQSNVLVNVPGTDLKDEEMIKLPINVINEGKGGWKHTLTLAHAKQQELEQVAQGWQAESGQYIRPIVLIRVERTGKEQRDAGFVHAEDAREYLRDQLGVKEEHVRLKTSSDDELADEDLLADTSPVRYIITKDALREGWDCPFAYALAVLSRTTANTALTQMIGRVLRQPYARATGRAALDECYVFTFDQEVTEAINSVRRGLEDEGMADLASSVKSVDPASGEAHNMRREAIKRRDKFAALPPIFLPRVLHRDSNAPDGYRPLDYDRDVLGALDWESLRFLGVDKAAMDADKLERTVARVTVDRNEKETGQTVFELEQETVEALPEEGLDAPYLVRQLLDVVPNPWQGMRLLEETLAALREQGVSDAQIYVNRLALVQDMKTDLREQVNAMAESLFREKLDKGEIALRLVSSNDPALNWKIAETLELEVSDVDPLLYRKNGEPLEKSLFEKVYQKEFNDLEKNTAWYLDESQCVYWWHRIAVNQRSYGLQGWQHHRVYPDLLACVHGIEDGKFRFSVLETKGDHLKGNDDTEYKQKLFELFTRYADVTASVGQLELEDQGEPMRFRMVMENDWKQTLVDEGV